MCLDLSVSQCRLKPRKRGQAVARLNPWKAISLCTPTWRRWMDLLTTFSESRSRRMPYWTEAKLKKNANQKPRIKKIKTLLHSKISVFNLRKKNFAEIAATTTSPQIWNRKVCLWFNKQTRGCKRLSLKKCQKDYQQLTPPGRASK